jgi:hypothetical protein
MNGKNIVEQLLNEINNINMIDTHEHIRRLEDMRAEGSNLFTSLKYSLVSIDCISSGMPPEYWSNNVDQDMNWKRTKPYLDNVKSANYYRTLVMNTYRDLYGFEHDEITDDNWKELSERISQAYDHDDFYEKIFKKLNVKVALLDPFWDPGYVAPPESLFVPAPGMDPFIFVRSGKTRVTNPGGFNDNWWRENPLLDVLKKWGVYFETFDEYMDIIDHAFERLQKNNGVGIKLRIGYSRPLKVDNVSKVTAEGIFNKSEDELTPEEVKQLEDFLIRRIIIRAIEYNFPIQIHTGLQGNLGGYTHYSDPLLLTNLFRDYPQAKFVIFHGSFPWASEAGVIVKGYPNVYLELCWLSWLLEDSAKKYLHEWLGLVPINKIVVGGDSETIDRAYTALKLSKKLVADVLAEKVVTGYYSREIALHCIKKIFDENPRDIYGIE